MDSFTYLLLFHGELTLDVNDKETCYLFTLFSVFQRVKDEVQRRKMQCNSFYERKDDELKLMKLAGFEQFYASLSAAKIMPTCPVQ